MLEAGAVRDVLVSRQAEKWTLAVRLGGTGNRWLPVITYISRFRLARVFLCVTEFGQSS
jgi:hypothetical protein